jgi:hypothetical protein
MYEIRMREVLEDKYAPVDVPGRDARNPYFHGELADLIETGDPAQVEQAMFEHCLSYARTD